MLYQPESPGWQTKSGGIGQHALDVKAMMACPTGYRLAEVVEDRSSTSVIIQQRETEAAGCVVRVRVRGRRRQREWLVVVWVSMRRVLYRTDYIGSGSSAPSETTNDGRAGEFSSRINRARLWLRHGLP